MAKKEKKASRAGGPGRGSKRSPTAKALRATRGRVQLRFASGATRETEASMVGPFAVHKATVGSGRELDYWVVTHVPTGYACGAGVRSLRRGLACARELLAIPVNWNFTTASATPKRARRSADAIVKRYYAELLESL